MRIGNYEFREDRFYTKDHLWVSIKGNIAKMGIDSYLLSKLSNITNVELTYIDNEVEPFDSIVSIYLDSDSLEIQSPFSGKIVNLNEDIEYDPDLLLHSNYDNGWLVEIELEDKNEVKKLMSGEQAEEWFRSEVEKE